MPTIAELRAANPWAEDISDLELLDYRAQQTGTSLEDAAKAFGVKYTPQRNAFTAGLSSGVDQLQGLGYGVLGAGARAIGLDSAAEWADKNVRLNNSEAQYNGRPDLENIEDQTLGSMPGYLVYQGAKQLPMIGGTIAASAAVPQAVIPAALSRGLAFAPRAIGGGGLSSGALQAAEGYAAKKALTNEALAAGNQFARIGATSYPLSVGSLYNEAVERGDPTQGDALAAFAGGVPYAAGEAIMPAIVNRGLRSGGLGFTGNLPTRMGKAAGVNALGEASTELFQNELEMGFAGPLTDDEVFSRRLNSAVAGGLVGGMYGAPSGIRKAVVPGAETDLLGGNDYPNQKPLGLPSPVYTGTPSDQLLMGDVSRANDVAAAERANRDLWASRQAYDLRDIPVGTQMGLPLDGGQMGEVDPMQQAAAGPLPAEYDLTNPARNRRQMDLVFPETPEIVYGNQFNPASQPGSTGQQAGAFTQLPVTDEIRTPPGAVQQAVTAINGTRTVAQLKATADQALANNLITPDQHVDYFNTLDTSKKLKLVDKRNLLTGLIEGNVNGAQTQKAVSPAAGQQATSAVANPTVTVVDAAKPKQVAPKAVQTPTEEAPQKPTGLDDLPRYKAEMGRWLTSQVSDEELQTFIGLNGLRGEDGNAEGYSTRALSKEMGVSHVTVFNRANAAKEKVDAAAQLAGIDLDTAYEILGLGSDVLDIGTPTAAYENGSRTVRADSDDFEDGFGYSRDEALGENEKGGIEDAYEDDQSDQNAVGSAEFEQVADGRDARADFARKLVDYKGDPISEVDFEDAAEEYNSHLEEGDVPFKELSQDKQIQVAKAYVAMMDSKLSAQAWINVVSEVADEAINAGRIESSTGAETKTVRGLYGEDSQASSGRARRQEAESLTNEKDSGRDQSAAGVREGSTSTGGNTRQGSGVAGILPGVSGTGVRKSEGTGEAENPTTVERISKQLRNLFFSQSRFDNKVTVVNTAEELPEGVRQSANPDGFTQAFVMPNGKAYMIASRIEQGQELGVFLHEVGVHLGMPGLIGNENFTKLAKQIGAWSQAKGDSIENRVARLAYARVTSAANTAQANNNPFEDADIAHELIAYFVEEAVNAGIKPSAAAKAGGPIYNWFRTMWAAVKTALRKFGLDRIDSLTTQNIVDLAYGAAALELDGTWHGTAADFRNFDHDYMGTGEGAQAFGWGTYLAQRPGIAKGYWTDDVLRKSKPTQNPIAWSVTTPGNDITVYEGTDNFGNDVGIVEFNGEWSVTRNVGVVGKFGSLAEAKKYAEYSGQSKPEGSMMRTSVAATEDEMLNWDKKQSAAILKKIGMYMHTPLQEALVEELNLDIDQMNGEDIYNGLKALEIRNGDVADYMDADTVNKIYSRNKNDKVGAMEVVSTYLDQMGIKGLYYLDAESRGRSPEQNARQIEAGEETIADLEKLKQEYLTRADLDILEGDNTETTGARLAKDIDSRIAEIQKGVDKLKNFVQTRNLVVFNDKNIVRAVTYQGADRNKVRFSSKANPSTPEGFFAKLGEQVQDIVDDPKAFFSRVKLGWMTLEQISDRIEKLTNATKVAAVKKYVNVMTAMQQYSKDMVYQAAKIDQDWAKLNDNVQKNLSEVMRTATRMSFDPAVDTPADDAQGVLQRKYNALPPTAKEVYTRVRDHYQKLFDERKAIMMKAAESGTMPAKNKAELEAMLRKYRGPYFPLMRLGNWYAVGMSRELSDLQEKVDAGEASAEETKRYEALRKDKANYITKSFNSRTAARRAQKELATQYDVAYFNTAKEQLDTAAKSVPDLSLMQDYLTSGLPSEARNDMKGMLAQMYFDLLPEQSALKRMMKREGIYGEEEDMRKVFSASTISMSHHVSRLKYSSDMSAAMQEIRKLTKQDEQMTNVYNELVARSNLAMKMDDTPFADRMTQLSYLANLGISPAFILTNMSQVPMITAPWLGARYGFGNTRSALSSAFVDATRIIKGTIEKDGWQAEYDWSRQFKEGSGEDGLLKALLDMNLLDITMEHDLGAVARSAKTKTGKAYDTFIKASSLPVRLTEVANRLITGLSAYRLEMAKLQKEGKLSPEEMQSRAIDMAAKAVSETQLNYSALNAPRYMQSVFGSKALAKLMFQFRKYQQGMVYLIGKSAADAFKGDKEAAKTLFGLMATTGVMAGATGLPFAGSVFWLATAIGSMFDDDDEPFDAEVTFANYLAEALGDEAALAVRKGLPTLMGVDLSNNVGMSTIGMPLPFIRNGNKPSENMSNMLAASAGASFQTVQTIADGIVEIAEGEFAKGVEKVTPIKGAKNIMKAIRYSNEGMTDSKGNVILPSEQFTPWDLAIRGAGFSTTMESEYYDANSAMQNAKQAATDVRQKLLRDFAEAQLSGADVAEFKERIADFNTRHPEKGVRIDQSSLLKAVQQRKRMAQERTPTGLRKDKAMRPYLDRAAFADGE